MDMTFAESYFKEEEIQSLFIIIIGITSICLALIFLLIIKYSFFKGMAVPFLLIGSVQFAIGTIVYLRSAKDIVRVENMVRSRSITIKTEELPRMENVIKTFHRYQWIEFMVLCICIILFIRFYKSQQSFWKGLVIGLIIQLTLMLSLDTVAKKRAQNYIQHLNGFNIDS